MVYYNIYSLVFKGELEILSAFLLCFLGKLSAILFSDNF